MSLIMAIYGALWFIPVTIAREKDQTSGDNCDPSYAIAARSLLNSNQTGHSAKKEIVAAGKYGRNLRKSSDSFIPSGHPASTEAAE